MGIKCNQRVIRLEGCLDLRNDSDCFSTNNYDVAEEAGKRSALRLNCHWGSKKLRYRKYWDIHVAIRYLDIVLLKSQTALDCHRCFTEIAEQFICKYV